MAKSRKTVENQFQRDFVGPDLRKLLRKAHLPDDYPKASGRNQLRARMHVLTSWFDPKRPDVLVSNVDNLVAALFLWVEFYLKPAAINRGRYYYKDPTCKYDMVRNTMQPPKAPTEPTKAVMTATRRMGKTVTYVHQLMPMMSICRPFTSQLLSEINDVRTVEELGGVKEQIEENERIHSDFGADGVLFPRTSRAGKKWSGHHLKFIHHPGSEIIAHSLNSSQRGRGPIFGCIDDPEDEDNSYNKDFRRWLADKILRVYVSMFGPGGVFLWVGTPIHKGSCLSMAMRGSSEADAEEETSDKRFSDFYRLKYPLIYRDKKGEWVSHQPERYSIERFLHNMEINPIAVRAEVLCEPVTPGERVFARNAFRHGYMHCEGKDGGEYFLDLLTGDRKPWHEFKEGLRIFGAGDLADGSETDDDAGALVAVGVDSRRIIYVLDAFVKKCPAEALIEMSAVFGVLHKCEVFGWEKVALQVVINRMIARYYEKLRKEGKLVPQPVSVENAGKNKIRRILMMAPLFGNYEIRFLNFDPVKDDKGEIHTPVKVERRASYEELLGQIDEYTSGGIRGPDDAIDTLEMAIRVAGDARGEISDEAAEGLTTESVLAKWRALGLTFDKSRVPREAWTNEMHEEAQGLPKEGGRTLLRGVIPYV